MKWYDKPLNPLWALNKADLTSCLLSPQVHVCRTQRCRCLTCRCHLRKRSRHLHTSGWRCWKCSHQKALSRKLEEPGCLLYKGGHRTPVGGCRGAGGSLHSFSLLPQNPPSDPEPGPHRARVWPELCPLLSADVADSRPTSCRLKLVWLWGNKRLAVPGQRLKTRLWVDKVSLTECFSVEWYICVTSFVWKKLFKNWICKFKQKLQIKSKIKKKKSVLTSLDCFFLMFGLVPQNCKIWNTCSGCFLKDWFDVSL